MDLDERALDVAADELLTWGILVRDGRGLVWTRRFRAAVMREAARLSREEREGRAPEGAPLATAATAALATVAPAARTVHARLVVAAELAALPPSVREIVG